jgi:hypothetical protein
MSGETPCRSAVRWYCGQSAGRDAGGLVPVDAPELLRGGGTGRLVVGPVLGRVVVRVVGPVVGVLSPEPVHAASSNAATTGSSNRRTAATLSRWRS